MQQNERPRTRRVFLQEASALLGGAAIAGITTSQVAASSRRRAAGLGIALVGLGNYATGQLAPALQETERCHLAGIVTGTPAKAERWMQEYDIPTSNVYDYDSFDEIAGNADVDIVYVVLPNSMHPEYVIRAAEAGKHVITEKPMATSAADCERMIEACDRAGVKLSVGYRLQFEPRHQEIMRLGQEEVYGPVTAVEGSFAFTYRDTDAWRFSKEMAGGGALLDVGIYSIQGARYTIGEEPVSVRASAYNTRPDIFTEIYETILWDMQFPGGAVSTHTTSYSGNVNRLYMMSTRGWAEINPAYSYGGLSGRTSEGAMDFPQVTQQALQMDDFARCIEEDEESRVPGEEGLRDMKVIEAIYRSIDSGSEWVDV
ncbi:MAG: Gfo/Idh/MocA family oxidoreductase [Rhodothermales bacterium]